MSKTSEREYVATHLDREAFQLLRKLAERNERSLAAELRLAVAAWLAAQKAAA